MIAIVVSRADSASERIGKQLLDIADWDRRRDDSRPDGDGGGTYYRRTGAELRTFDGLHIHLDDPTPAFERPVDLLVYVSRHAGETGSLLTAHFTGNFGAAEHGGDDRELAPTAPAAQKRLVASFRAHAPEGYDVGIECTHHGPSETAAPSVFAELGSGPAQWDDPDGAGAVARAVLDLVDAAVEGRDAETEPESDSDGADSGSVDGRSVALGVDPVDVVGADGRTRHVVGFGGGHYAPRFTRIVAETDWGVGHVGSDWQLAEMGDPAENRDLLRRAFEASAADRAVVDGDRADLVDVIEDLGYRVVSETWIRAVESRPLALVEALETAVAPVDEGLRFGDVVPAVGTEPTVRDIDPTIDDRSADDDRTTDDDRSADNSQSTDDDRTTDVVVGALPAALLTEAQGIAPDAARTTVETHAIAFETEQAGTRAVGRAAFVEAADREALVDDLAAVLRRKYDEVTVGEDQVVAREVAFDPALATDRGVPEGPKFGRLAAGEPVDVDGETVEPADVRRRREERFPV